MSSAEPPLGASRNSSAKGRRCSAFRRERPARGFASTKLYCGYASNGYVRVDYFTSYEIANIRRAGFELCLLRAEGLATRTAGTFRRH